MLRREIRDERRENFVILERASAIGSMMVIALLFLAVSAFAAPKSAAAYYSDAAFQYIENRLPSAEITCNEGLQQYPNDQKLQMLLDRIHEAKDEQKNENKKNDPKNDQNQDNNDQNQNDQNQDQNQDKQNQDQNKDQQNQNQDQNQNQNGDQSSSSSSEDQNQDQQNQGQNGASSSSQGNQSSDSNGGGQQQQPEQQQPETGSSDSNGSDQEQQQPLQPGELSPEEAAQLLKDFDEQNGERKPWKPIRGQVRPAKDW